MWSVVMCCSYCRAARVLMSSDVVLTHIQTAVRLRPAQSMRLKSRKQATGMK